jgi:hypothetical protein
MSAAVALLVSFYAYKSNRLLGSSLLRYICAGFLLLGVGIGIEGFTLALVGLTPIQVTRFSGLVGLVFLIDVVLQLVAYGVFAWGYALSAFGRQKQVESAAVVAGALATDRVIRVLVFSLGIFLFAQLGIIVLMLFVVVQGAFAYSRTGNGLALTVLFAFALILIAHGVLFLSVIYLSTDVYLVGTLIQFLGFLSLLYFLYRSSRIGST